MAIDVSAKIPGTTDVALARDETGKTSAVPGVFVFFALEREAGRFRRAAHNWKHITIYVSGVGRKRARIAAQEALRNSIPQLVVAAGFCGALIPALSVGDVVTSPRIITVDHLVSDPTEKRRLGECHDAVDMESSAIAELCQAKGIPFLAVRAISDTVDAALSPELLRLLSGGNVSVWKACGALVKKPALLSEFLQLGRDTKLAARNLANALVELLESRANGEARRENDKCPPMPLQ